MEGNLMLKKIRKAVIPAAGFGTRFLPATKATPKEMLPIVDTPTIQYIVGEVLASGIEELERKGKDTLLQVVRETAAIKVHYIRQREMKGLDLQELDVDE